MKIKILIATCLLSFHANAFESLTVSNNTLEIIPKHQSFFVANSNLLNAAVAPSGGGGGGSAYAFDVGQFIIDAETNISINPTNWTTPIANLEGATNYLEFALSDEYSDVIEGTALTWRAPFAMTLISLRASINTTNESAGLVVVDIHDSGTTIMGTTKLSIDANEKTSTTAADAAVLSDTAIADDAEITFDVDTAGTGVTGLKVKIFYTKP